MRVQRCVALFVCVDVCVFGSFVCAANTHKHTYLVVGVRGSLCLCRCVCVCVLDSYMRAHLHALALELVHTPGGGRSADAAVRGSVCLCRCVC